ncbi:MAG: ribosome biogenesis GTP-binding protein YihA/YsxC [Chitinophagaceae bacterium]
MEIKQAGYLISSASYTQCPAPDRAEFAFIGRSNVGKSSLINMICNKQNMARTSATPGKTQLINHYDIESSNRKKWYIVDLPGYGYAKVSQSNRKQWEEMIEQYLRRRENLRCVFVLIDSRHTPQTIDLEFIEKLGKWQVPIAIIFTKADKNKPGATRRHVQQFIDRLHENWEESPPFFVSSAITREGRELLLQFMEDLLAESKS